jgi:hypothetical protein
VTTVTDNIVAYMIAKANLELSSREPSDDQFFYWVGRREALIELQQFLEAGHD